MQSIHFNAYVGQDGLVQFQSQNYIKKSRS
jgi:hypothetical protein